MVLGSWSRWSSTDSRTHDRHVAVLRTCDTCLYLIPPFCLISLFFSQFVKPPETNYDWNYELTSRNYNVKHPVILCHVWEMSLHTVVPGDVKVKVQTELRFTLAAAVRRK